MSGGSLSCGKRRVDRRSFLLDSERNFEDVGGMSGDLFGSSVFLCVML